MVTLAWPFPPRAFREKYTHLTDVQVTYSSEHRRSLRKGAFLSVVVDSGLAETELPFAEAIYKAALESGENVAVPLWPQAMSIPGNLSAGTAEFILDTSTGDWFHGIALLWETPTRWEVVSIADAAEYLPGNTRPSSLVLVSPTVQDYTSPLLVPAAECFFLRGLTIGRGGFNAATVSAEFRGIDDLDIGRLTWSTVAGYPVMSSPVVAANVSDSIVRPEVFVDNGTGPVVRVAKADKASVLYGLTFSEQDREKKEALRNNLLSLRGRKEPFILPSRNIGEVTMTTPFLGGDTARFIYPGPRTALIGRKVLVRRGSNTYLREIISVTLTTAVLDAAVPVVTANPYSISLCHIGRLDGDELEMVATPGGGCRIGLSFKELPDV